MSCGGRRVNCQACGSVDLDVFYEVDNVPVHSCIMVDTRQEALTFPRGNLRLSHCERCGVLQNSTFSSEAQAYNTTYEGTQGFSPRFCEFLTGVCKEQIHKYDRFLTQMCARFSPSRSAAPWEEGADALVPANQR